MLGHEPQVAPDAFSDVYVVHRGGDVSGRFFGNREDAGIVIIAVIVVIVIAVVIVAVIVIAAAAVGELHAVAADIALEAVGQLDEVPGVIAAPDG